MKRLFLLLIAATMAHVCTAQIRYDNNAWTAATNVPIGSQAPIYTVPYALVSICTDSSCASLVPIYSNQGLTIPISQPFKADALGRFGFWAATGTYWSNTCSAAGKCFGRYITLGASGSGGTGTVTSVGLSLPALFSVTGSPVTVSGTLAASLATQNANQVFAGPSSGSAAAPTFRSLVLADLPASLFTLTTSGTSGAATYSGGILNIPNYATGGGGSGTVTSVGMTVPSIFGISGSPVTTSGTLALSLTTQTAHTFFSGPGTGSPVAPTFRSIIPSDLPVATTSSLGAVQPDGTTITVSGGVISAVGGGGSSAFNALTSGTNTTAAMLVGSGASLGPTGTGTIQATNIASTIAAGTNVTITGAGTVASPYSITASATGSTAFSALTGSTNTTAAMLVGTGASLAPTGSGTVTANAVNLAASGNGGVTGLLPHANIAATAVTPGSYTSANITVAADGSITSASNGSGGGSGISGQAAGVVPLASTATTIGAQSHIDDGITTAATITATEPIAITGSTHGVIIPAGTAASGAAGKVVFASDSTSGFGEMNQNAAGLERIAGWNTANVFTAAQTMSGLAITGSGVAGYTDWQQGTAPGTQLANSVRFFSPTSVPTSYAEAWPSAAPSGSNTLLSCLSGACTWSSSTGLSGLTAGFIPQATSATTIADSLLDSGITNASGLTYTGLGIYQQPTGGNNASLHLFGSGGSHWLLFSDGSAGGKPGWFGFFDGTGGVEAFAARVTGAQAFVVAPSTGCWGWNNQAAFPDGTLPDTCLSRGAAGQIDIGNGTIGDTSGVLDVAQIQAGILYSAAGTALPSCVSGLKGRTAMVSDATSPTYLGTYTSGGAVMSPVACNGSNWVTY